MAELIDQIILAVSITMGEIVLVLGLCFACLLPFMPAIACIAMGIWEKRND